MKTKSLGSVRKSFSPWTDPDAKPFIRFENVTKTFDGTAAIDDLSADVYEREFFALLGASGSGKSTLLRLLAGFETPTRGRIVLDGEDMTGIPPHKRPVNMMFQSYALFPHMNVEQNIAFGLKQDGMAKSERNDRIAEVLKLVKLENYGRRKPHQLSGGQQQRVALARSLVKRPKVLLLDEPLGALDKKLREETQFELTDLQYELGITFIMVTHDQEEAMTMADRIAVMGDGRILQIGTPPEIYEAPTSRFVADFIGTVNIFDGTVTARNGDRLKLETGAGHLLEVDANEESVSRARSGEKAAYAVRPEKLRISAKELTGPNVLSGEVWEIAYIGDMTSFHLKMDDGKIVRVSMVNASRESPVQLTWHDRAWVSFDPDAGLLLAN
ncbi:ABC transporter, polyamine transport protein, ATP-binding protein [Fulvimarina pelagi HTCC2506]|uniref:Spermidine/putrescine import ATP-binding protein PotA n=1 Tax=Fulvimarina pelagi HTCC2506 TaxID=314231 RepID=Q0G552_9HYPH|nr:ABC transporter ATP-binding protein [Fulvimarina pelagi]EAU43212.1 ABC transporter, polyamine transport protein, ATP-binding protein [Fulvimarina pelagi HTCC2506]